MDSILQNRVFRSKIGWVAFVPLILCCVVALFTGFKGGLILFPLLFTGFGIALTFWMLDTTYTITADQQLKIKCLFIRLSIPISSIRKIEKTHSMISAYGCSFNKIEIAYNRYDGAIISPKDKEEFIAQLKTINPAIDVTL